MSRIFIFIDESGDVGNHIDASSSRYYQLNVVVATREMLGKMALQFSRFRYFTDAEKEIDKYLRGEKTRRIITDIFSILAHNAGVQFFAFRVEKSKYVGPYYEPLDSKKLRNFIIRVALEKVYENAKFSRGLASCSYTLRDAESVEIVIDRFVDSYTDEQNLQDYLKGNYNLQKVLHVVQIDSEYSEHMQCADVLGKIIKKHLENDGSIHVLDFVRFFDISNPRSASEVENRRIEKDPDTQGGTRS